MTQAAATVVRRQIVVEAPIERAFAVFTERFGDFKPREHNMLGVPIAETVFEPKVGGHIYDRGEDGSECRWARVLAFEPPNRVVLGAWPNQALGNRRANAVKKYLVDKGIDAGRLNEMSSGEKTPLEAGKGEEAWAKNRRVEFSIVSADRPLAMKE